MTSAARSSTPRPRSASHRSHCALKTLTSWRFYGAGTVKVEPPSYDDCHLQLPALLPRPDVVGHPLYPVIGVEVGWMPPAWLSHQ
jgi:hypothetical protein